MTGECDSFMPPKGAFLDVQIRLTFKELSKIFASQTEDKFMGRNLLAFDGKVNVCKLF